jgi:hypothetical protein
MTIAHLSGKLQYCVAMLYQMIAHGFLNARSYSNATPHFCLPNRLGMWDQYVLLQAMAPPQHHLFLNTLCCWQLLMIETTNSFYLHMLSVMLRMKESEHGLHNSQQRTLKGLIKEFKAMPSNPLSVIWGPDLGAAYGI